MVRLTSKWSFPMPDVFDIATAEEARAFELFTNLYGKEPCCDELFDFMCDESERIALVLNPSGVLIA